MMKLFLLFLLASLSLAFPAQELLDKATAEDIALNDVASDKKDVIPEQTNTNIQSTAVINESFPTSTYTPVTPTVKPRQPASMFARIIDDIFQIPITVLQSVSKLLTNPFNNTQQRTPETASGY